MGFELTNNNHQTTLPADTVDVEGNPLEATKFYVYTDAGWAEADALLNHTGTLAIGYNLSDSYVDGFVGLVDGENYYINEGGGIISETDMQSQFQSGSIVRLIGTAHSVTKLYFKPDETWLELNSVLTEVGIADLKPELKATIQLLTSDTEIDISRGVAFNIPQLTVDKTLTFSNEIENKMIKLILNLNNHALTLPANVNVDDLELDGGDVWEVIQIECTNINGTLKHKALKLM